MYCLTMSSLSAYFGELTDAGVFVKEINTFTYNSDICLSTYMSKIFVSYVSSSSSTDWWVFELDTNIRCIRSGTGSYSIGQIIESKLRYPLMVTDAMTSSRQTSITASNYYLGSITEVGQKEVE